MSEVVSSVAAALKPFSSVFDFPSVLLRRERSKVPLIVRQCVEEIERRGMEEVGIYRVSGVATDIQALKAAFDSSELDLVLSFRPASSEDTDLFLPQTTETCRC